MQTISSVMNMTPADLRDIAFRDLERSLATIKHDAEHLPSGSLIVLHMIGAIGVAESSLKIIAMTPGAEVRALSGPRHGEHDVLVESGGAIPVEATEVETHESAEAKDAPKDEAKSDAAPAGERPATNGANGNGVNGDSAATKGGPRAHAEKKYRCGGHDLGCDHKRINGNSHGRHQQLCAYFQTGRLLEAGYQIDTIEDYAKALKKEYGALPYDSVENMRKGIDQKHGSYRKVLLAVRRGLKARAKAKKAG